MRRDMQERLAALRTDLDAFTDLEAYGLMESAYLAAKHEWSRCSPDFPKDQSTRFAWSFDKVRQLVASSDDERATYERTATLLNVGHRRMWKHLALIPGVDWMGRTIGRFSSAAPGLKKFSERAVALAMGAFALPSALQRRFGTPRWLEMGLVGDAGGNGAAKGDD